ncbi:MAG: TIGR00725 family protein [Candidatus Euphemobacter frigidus]|nr:TIGR00725 family protein [Candidatus Euphemobacter frigidus]MDP8276343.1 TIGR00725 family protein [Candidatus Euphemobacter frigidus]
MLISVIGGNRASREMLREAEELGRGLARRGLTVVCGGLGGVMEAVCRGAKTAGGCTVGILPGSRAEAANAHVDIPIPTGIGLARNAIVALAGEAVIAIDGSHGTLTEIAYALNFGKPVIGIQTWDIRGMRPASNAESALRILDELLSLPPRPII